MLLTSMMVNDNTITILLTYIKWKLDTVCENSVYV